ncbi:hypothetical protein ABFA07_002835 [Porites harrisoni]
MSDTKSTSCPPPTLVDGKYYRVWSLTSQGFLTLKPKDGGKCGEKFADFSGTGKENSSKIKAKKKPQPTKRGFFLEFQEGEGKYVLQANTEDKVSVKLFSDISDANHDKALFYDKDFGVDTQVSLFKALMILGQEGKCLASNGEKELSLKTYNQYSPHPDTLFLITEVV